MPIRIKRLTRRWTKLCALVALAVLAVTPASAADKKSPEMDAGTLAATIRSLGHPCKKVHEMTKTSSSSWRVRCNSGSFHVTLSNAKDTMVKALD